MWWISVLLPLSQSLPTHSYSFPMLPCLSTYVHTHKHGIHSYEVLLRIQYRHMEIKTNKPSKTKQIQKQKQVVGCLKLHVKLVKKNVWFLASGPVCKEPVSHQSLPQNKRNLNKLKNNDFLDPLENWSHRANCCCQNWKDRYIQRITTYLSTILWEETPVGTCIRV